MLRSPFPVKVICKVGVSNKRKEWKHVQTQDNLQNGISIKWTVCVCAVHSVIKCIFKCSLGNSVIVI